MSGNCGSISTDILRIGPSDVYKDFRDLLTTLNYEDSVFRFKDSDDECSGNKLFLSIFSKVIKSARRLSKKNIDDVILLDNVSRHEFILFKYFVYQNKFMPSEEIDMYYNLAYTFDSPILLNAVYKKVSIEDGDLNSIIKYLKMQHSRRDLHLLKIIQESRKKSLEELRTSNILLLMDMKELETMDYKSLIKFWNCFDSLIFIESWIDANLSSKNVYRELFYKMVNLATLDPFSVFILPEKIMDNIINFCSEPEQITYVKMFKYLRFRSIWKLTNEKGHEEWFLYIMKWYSVNEAENIKNICKMLEHVDFLKISPIKLEECLNKNSSLFKDNEVYTFFVNKIQRCITYLNKEYNSIPLVVQPFKVESNNGPDSQINNKNDCSNVDEKKVDGDNVKEGSINYGNNCRIEDTVSSEGHNNDSTNISEVSVMEQNVDENDNLIKSPKLCLENKSQRNIKKVSEKVEMPITKYCENVNNSNNVSKNEESEIFLLESEFLSRRITRRHANKASKSIKDDDDQIINSPFEDIKVFFVGGVTGRSREYYRPAKNIHFSSLYQRYEDFPQLDTPRMLTRLCQYKDNLYAVGGKSYSNNKWDSALELMVYDVDFESWTALDIYLDYDRVEHDVSVINDEMYIVGGNVEPEDKYGIVMYNFEKDYFSPIHSSYNDIVFQHTNIVRDNVIYIVGGYKNNQRKIIQLFDPRVGKVQMLLEPERQHLQSANILYNDTIYCFGGIDEKLNPTDNSDYFDIRANRWGSLEKMPSHRYACGAFIISNKVFVSGGIGVTTGTCREVEKYDIHGNKWFQGLNMVDGRGFFGVLQI